MFSTKKQQPKKEPKRLTEKSLQATHRYNTAIKRLIISDQILLTKKPAKIRQKYLETLNQIIPAQKTALSKMLRKRKQQLDLSEEKTLSLSLAKFVNLVQHLMGLKHILQQEDSYKIFTPSTYQAEIIKAKDTRTNNLKAIEEALNRLRERLTNYKTAPAARSGGSRN